MKKTTLLFAACALFATAFAQESLTIVGSDLLKSAVHEGLARFAKDQGLQLNADMTGTIPGIKDLRAGKADFAILARPLGTPGFDDEFAVRPLCEEVVYVVVNATNPLSEISLRQLASIFGSKSEGVVERWSAVGVSGTRGMRPLLAFAPPSDSGLSVEIFKNIALDGAGFKPNVRTLESDDLLASTVATQDGAIGFLNKMPEKENISLKVLAISTGRGAQGTLAFLPTMENAYLGDYSLSLPFYVVMRKEDVARMTPVLHYLYSDEFSMFLEKKGFLPLPQGIRRNLTLGVDTAK